MANNYVVTRATYIPGSAPDPTVTIVGSVNGIPVTVTMWLSAITQANTQQTKNATASKDILHER